MFKNFIKTTLRTLVKNKTYSFLNIFGLATGVACAGLIFLWVEDEMHFDTFQQKKNNLYSLANNQNFDGKIFTFTGVNSQATPGPAAEAVKTQIPGVANTARMSGGNRSLFTLGDKSVYETGKYADSSILNMFTLEFVQGKAANAFKQLNSIVITERMAKHFFGEDKNVVGKVLKADNANNFTVSGVIKNLPDNSSISFDWLAPFEIYYKQNSYLTSWGANAINTFVELSPGANITSINKALYGLVQKHEPTSNTRMFLFSMNDWHLRSKFVDGKQAGGGIDYVQTFSIIAWIILVIACINFMNLATARSEKRAKEVGVRKVMGAGKGLLIAQFIGEAICMAAIAVIVGVALIILVMPMFNILVQKQLSLGLSNPVHIAALAGIAIFSGIVAGSYPALYLSSFNPIFVFKGIKLKSGGAAVVRKGLVVLQFTTSIILIISTIIIYQQIQHIKSRDLGYNRNNLVTIPVNGNIIQNFDAIKLAMINTNAVENVALNSMNVLDRGDNGSISNLQWDGKNPNLNVLVSFRSINPGFINTAGMHMAAGREFTNVKNDSTNILVTESFAKLMGKGNPIGKLVTGGPYKFTIIGLVKDYVYDDMYGSPDPVVFTCNPQQASYVYVRLKPTEHPGQAITKLGAVMKTFNPAYPFEYTFLDDAFNQLFTGEMLVSKLSRIFAILAIIISCLGLFGLSAYTAERRTKEIGIRKVLGASITNITNLLSKEFVTLVVIASLIAFPVAWYTTTSWLQQYTYRISVNWWVFLAAGASALIIALATISFQSVKAALMNPVKSLRTE